MQIFLNQCLFGATKLLELRYFKTKANRLVFCSPINQVSQLDNIPIKKL